MKLKSIFMLVIAISLLASCGKEGPQGIPGPQGDKGDQGAVGAVGPAGQDGSIIYSGTGTPASSIGKNGDYYLDKNTGDLYGPKASSGWGTALTLKGSSGVKGDKGDKGDQGDKGATGATGAAGSQILSGSGVPSASLGKNGDFFLDKENYFLYGPKTSSGWGTPTLLRGAQGPQGPQGPAGVPGSQMFSGTGTPDTKIGNAGDYYLDKNTGNLYGPKTSGGWGNPLSLKGTKGDKGDKGDQGATGATGAAGSQILSGSNAPTTGIGKTGDYYIDTLHAVMYGPKSATGWESTGLSLQVNNTITYEFFNSADDTLPYFWGRNYVKLNPGVPVSRTPAEILLPFDNAATHTAGFTIPQDIVDNGIVLTYMQYYQVSPIASDTLTGPGDWFQLSYIDTYIGQDEAGTSVYTPFIIEYRFDYSGLNILLKYDDGNIPTITNVYCGKNCPYRIRVVLIPKGKVTTLENRNPTAKLSIERLDAIINNDENNKTIRIAN